MTEYTDDTPVTPDLMAVAIAIELGREPIDWARVRKYMVHRYALTRDAEPTSAVFKPKS